MFREADMFSISPNELLVIVLLLTIFDKNILVKVLEQLRPTHSWEDVKDAIITYDRVNAMSGDYMTTKTKQYGAAVQPNRGKECNACGRKGHIRKIARLQKRN